MQEQEPADQQEEEEDPTFILHEGVWLRIGTLWYLTRPPKPGEWSEVAQWSGAPYSAFEHWLNRYDLWPRPAQIWEDTFHNGTRLETALEVTARNHNWSRPLVPDLFIPVREYDPNTPVWEVVYLSGFCEPGYTPLPFGLAGLVCDQTEKEYRQFEMTPPADLPDFHYDPSGDPQHPRKHKSLLELGTRTGDRVLKEFAEQHLPGGLSDLPRYNQLRIAKLGEEENLSR